MNPKSRSNDIKLHRPPKSDAAGSATAAAGGPAVVTMAGFGSLFPINFPILKQLVHDGPSNRWTLAGRPIHEVTIIGTVSKFNHQDGVLQLVLLGDESMPDSLPVNQLLDPDAAGSITITDRMVVRVFGTLKTAENQLFLNAYHIRPVLDPAELEFHQMDVQFSSQVIGRADLKAKGPSMDAKMEDVKADAKSDIKADAKSDIKADAKSDVLDAQILGALSTSEVGSSIDEIDGQIRKLRTSKGDSIVEKSAVAARVKFLQEEGMIYTTIDEEHFKRTG